MPALRKLPNPFQDAAKTVLPDFLARILAPDDVDISDIAPGPLGVTGIPKRAVQETIRAMFGELPSSIKGPLKTYKSGFGAGPREGLAEAVEKLMGDPDLMNRLQRIVRDKMGEDLPAMFRGLGERVDEVYKRPTSFTTSPKQADFFRPEGRTSTKIKRFPSPDDVLLPGVVNEEEFILKPATDASALQIKRRAPTVTSRVAWMDWKDPKNEAIFKAAFNNPLYAAGAITWEEALTKASKP